MTTAPEEGSWRRCPTGPMPLGIPMPSPCTPKRMLGEGGSKLEDAAVSAVRALRAARDADIRLRVDGGDLVLEAFAPPPGAVLELLARHKAEIVALYRAYVAGAS